MKSLNDITPPDNLDWHVWMDRYDKMSEQYSVKRNERFQIIVRLIRETQPARMRVLDLGCANGSLMLSVLDAIPQAEVIGIDYDPTVMWLSKAKLQRFGKRYRLILTDLRDSSWTKSVQEPLEAVISSHTLHMFDASQLASLYRQISQVLRPDGIFLNSDQVRSNSPMIQQAWDRLHTEVRTQEAHHDSDDWDGFWDKYSKAIGLNIREIHQRLLKEYKGAKKERLPLVWHLNRLIESGLSYVDCFWRCSFDAIYGGIR